jgi:hypothetical protein
MINKQKVKLLMMLLMIVFALGFLGICVGFLAYETKEVTNGTFLEKLVHLKPSEIGDALAGVFGSLAFLAAAIAVVMQSSELRAQRQELKLTRDVLEEQKKATKEMAEAQQKQVELLIIQGEMIKTEREHRNQDAAKKVFDALIEAIAADVQKEAILPDNFRLKPRYEMDLGNQLPFSEVGSESPEQLVTSLDGSVSSFRRRVFGAKGNTSIAQIKQKSKQQNYYRKVLLDLDYLVGMQGRLSEDQTIRFDSMYIAGAREGLSALVDAEIWDVQVVDEGFQ